MAQFINNQYTSIEQVSSKFLANKNKVTGKIGEKAKSFEEVLQMTQSLQKSTELKFSKHANERLASRNIDLSESQYRRLESGAKKASEKGMRESLVMVDEFAFIVNVNNNTVITAVNALEDKVFTNIDGAVIM